MISDGGTYICLVVLSRGKQHQVPEGLGPILIIYQEKFHLLNQVIKFPS